MNHELKDFIDLSQHYGKVNRAVQKIRNQHPQLQTNVYLNDLFDYFIGDIGNVANQIYDGLLLKKSVKGTKVTPAELKNLIKSGTELFLQNYDRIIQGYNAGGMFREYDNVQVDIDSFKKRAKQTCENQSDIYSVKYKDQLKKQRKENWTFYASIIAAITGLVGVPVWYGQTSLHVTEKQRVDVEKNNSSIAYSYTGYLSDIFALQS